MKENAIFQKILKDIEPFYNIINIVLSASLLSLSVFYLLTRQKTGFVYFGIFAGFVGVILYVLRKKIAIRNKLTITLIFLILFVLRSFLSNGFIGSGFLGISLLITLSILFLSPKRSILLASLSIAIYMLIAVLINYGLVDITNHLISANDYKAEWYAQFVTLLICTTTVYISIHSIKKILFNSLGDLESNNSQLLTQSEELKVQREKLKKLAYFDTQTKLYNYYYLTEVLPLEIDCHNDDVFVSIIDVRELKLINSLYGSSKINEHLKVVFDTFNSNLPNDAFLGRYSSDEFVFIIPNWTMDDFTEYLSQGSKLITNSLEILSIIERQPYFISHTSCNLKEISLVEAYKSCRIAIDYAVDNKASYIVEYKAEMSQILDRKTKLLSLIDNAIENSEFQVWFQGKYYLDHSKFMGYEALSRWFLDTGEFISPTEFIPLVNNTKYLVPFNEMIIKKSISEFERLQKYSEDKLSLSINISPLFLSYIHFESIITDIVQVSTLSPSQVILEITEDVFFDNSEKNNQIIHRLKEKGFRFSLDDFGSGFSSLSQIAAIEINELKIDRSIIKEVLSSKKSQTLIELVSKLGRTLSLQIVAEGVECKEEVEMLKQYGINIIQGYHYTKPQSVDKLVNHANESS